MHIPLVTWNCSAIVSWHLLSRYVWHHGLVYHFRPNHYGDKFTNVTGHGVSHAVRHWSYLIWACGVQHWFYLIWAAVCNTGAAVPVSAPPFTSSALCVCYQTLNTAYVRAYITTTNILFGLKQRDGTIFLLSGCFNPLTSRDVAPYSCQPCVTSHSPRWHKERTQFLWWYK